MKVPATLILLAVMALPASASEIPLPRPKPGLPALEPLAVAMVPLPRKKPGAPVAEEGEPFTTNPGRIDWPDNLASWSKKEVGAARAECVALLGELAVDWSPVAPIGGPGRCGMAAPIEVRSIAGTDIKPPANLNCRTVAALHHWIATELQPAAKKKLGVRVASIRNASSYACRRRNNSRSGKISEHAFGNAFDMSDFEFAGGKQASVAGDWRGLFQFAGLSKRGGFLREIRQAACKHFTTVLGPGSDSSHGDHFHVDLAKRRSGYRICK
ncbi:MAG: extensin family protein [Rhizobiales bacterium]|nr:extensin family protein [Hyphomicrobiales bacterium]